MTTKTIHRRAYALALFLFGFSAMLPAEADDKPWGQINDHLRVMGEFRARYEVWDFFRPPAVNHNNEYGFWGLRGRLGVLFDHEYLESFVQAEYSGLHGLPEKSVALPGGPLGLGGAYYGANHNSTSASDVHLKQAYVNLKLAPWGLPGGFAKVGRFDIQDGMEYKTGDAKFDGLKASRASQRLIGPFDFAHATRSFDGFNLVYDQPAVNVNLSGSHPTQGGFDIHGQDEISHISLFYAAITGKRGAVLPGTESRLFYIYYGDDRNTQVVDNRPTAQQPLLSRRELKLHTVGTHVLTLQKLGDGELDGLLWGAYQFGDWTNLDHQAGAFDVEGGYQFSQLALKPWIRGGYYLGTGDGDPKDGRHNSFFQILPTVRPFAKFPFFNMMNIRDAFAQFIVTPTPSTRLVTDFHHLSLEDSADLFYAGSGASSRSGAFGYVGRPSNGRSTIGELIDISFTHTLTKELAWSAYYGHVFGGNYINTLYTDKKYADFAYVELNLNF